MRTVLLLLIVATASVFAEACAKDPCADPKVERAKLDFTLKDMNGADVRLADYRGRPLIINFWATWCGPCKEEIPALIELAAKYKSNGLAVLGVSIDDKPEELKKFAAEYKMSYPVLVGLGHDDMLAAFEAEEAVPVSWLVQPCGAVAVKRMGVWTKDEFEAAIRKLL
jgi:thiol-disulfide isomerase/thioredoxin